MARLTLDTTGIKSPLDMDERGRRTPVPAKRPETKPAAKRRVKPGETTKAAPSRSRRSSARSSEAQASPATFYGGGRPIQTSIALDPELVAKLEELSRAGAVSFNALLVAVLQAGLPRTGDDACRAAVHERAERPRAARVESNVRLPEQLRVRLDQLTSNVRDTAKRATRADLTNAVLRATMPTGAEPAAQLVNEHRRRLELLALAA